MGPTMKDLGIDKLPQDQRRALFQEIVASLGDLFTPEVVRHDSVLDDRPTLNDADENVQAHRDAGI